ncbi:MAG: 5-(carboxyamino)imidazole ribonucleotide mutase [Candidatus Ancillula trichonymphae]|jgi:5-(carboxyamino)imidazole ribonucleotide mutase|nr:5-(carboxyamino)imidazole ribonucleotide mutase [Candidatus Ancillula trichonymphae]
MVNEYDGASGGERPVVAIFMGSKSDLKIMQAAADVLEEFGIPHTIEVKSAHRMPFDMLEVAKTAEEKGYKLIIAGAGGAAHLPGMLAAATTLPVIGVPVSLQNLSGLDSLLSIVQMPSGVPVAAVSIDGARNAGILAARILGVHDSGISQKLHEFSGQLYETARAQNDEL